MSKGNTFENELLLHIFNNATLPLIGDAAGLLASATAGSLYIALHTADPGEAGVQTTNEAAYTGYARVAVARAVGGFTVSGNSVTLTAVAAFPVGTAGGETCTHWSVGTAASAAGKILYSGTLTPDLVTGNTIIPRMGTTTAITED